MEYKASLDWAALTVIAFVTIVFTGIIAAIVNSFDTSKDLLLQSFVFAFTAILLAGIYIICYIFRPLKYIIDSGKIIIKRPYKDKVIELSSIKAVYTITKDSMGWVHKTFGNGGLFGYYGEFRCDRYGDMTWYATRRTNYVMLETHDHERIVLTPDNVDMVNEIKKLIVQKSSF